MLLRNYYRAIAALVKGVPQTGTTYESCVDYVGNSFSLRIDVDDASKGPFKWNAAAGAINYGLVCGSDNTPVDPADYYVKGVIGHGDTDGSLSYDEVQTVEEWSAEGVYTLTVSRFVTNNGTVDVVVKETSTGVLVYGDSNGDAPKYMHVAREVLGTPITITPGGSRRIVNTFTITPPYVS